MIEASKQHNTRLFVILLLGVIFQGCGDTNAGPVKRSWGKMKGLEKVVGNMNNTSYSTIRNQKPRFNALNKPVSISQFEGKFVWGEYAAPWCSPCVWQAPQTQKVEKALGDRIVFLTTMTSRGHKYNDHATVETAKEWANRFKLNPEHVLAAELWYKTIPEHRFFSPMGHTLFVHVGTLSAEQIKATISFYKKDWENWNKTKKPAPWMTFQ